MRYSKASFETRLYQSKQQTKRRNFQGRYKSQFPPMYISLPLHRKDRDGNSASTRRIKKIVESTSANKCNHFISLNDSCIKIMFCF